MSSDKRLLLLKRIQPAPKESGLTVIQRIPSPTDTYAAQRARNPTSPLTRIIKGDPQITFIEPTTRANKETSRSEIESKLKDLEQAWESSHYTKEEILNLPLNITRLPTISTLNSVLLFLDPNLTSTPPKENDPTKIHSKDDYTALARNLCYSLLPTINKGRLQSQEAYPPEELIDNPSDPKFYSNYINKQKLRKSLNTTRMSHLKTLRPLQTKIKALCDKIAKDSQSTPLIQLEEVFVQLWELIDKLITTLQEDVVWSILYSESSNYIQSPAHVHPILDAEIERARIYAELETFRRDLVAWSSTGQFRTRQFEVWQSVLTRWDNPEIQSSKDTKLHPEDSSENNGDMNTTVINTYEQTKSTPTTQEPQSQSTNSAVTSTPVSTPNRFIIDTPYSLILPENNQLGSTPPPPPNLVNRDIDGAHGWTANHTSWQTALSNIDSFHTATDTGASYVHPRTGATNKWGIPPATNQHNHYEPQYTQSNREYLDAARSDIERIMIEQRAAESRSATHKPQTRSATQTQSDEVDMSIKEMGQEMRKMADYQEILQKENAQTHKQNKQLSEGLQQITEQFRQLQLELNENQSRMATLKRDHESEMIRANRAYKEALNQMQNRSRDSAHHHTYTPGYYNTSSMQYDRQQTTAQRHNNTTPILPWEATTNNEVTNPTSGFPPPTRTGGTVNTEQERQQATRLRLMLESSINLQTGQPTNGSQPPTAPQQSSAPTNNTDYRGNNFEIPPFPTPHFETTQPQPPQNNIEPPCNNNPQPNNQNGNDLTTIFRMMMTSKTPSMNHTPFDGTYEFFDEWYQEFHSKIHTNILLTKYDKLMLLEKETSGRARTMVTTCGRQENSYELAITKLKNTYQGHDSKLQKLYARIKQTTPLTSENQSKYARFADDVQIFINHLLQNHNEKLITDSHRYCDEILYRLPRREILECEKHKKEHLERNNSTQEGYVKFLGYLVTHTQKVAAEHRQRLKITRSLGLHRDHRRDNSSKQSFLASSKSHSRCVICKGSHGTQDHPGLTAKQLEQFCNKNNRCYGCFEPWSARHKCLYKTKCKHCDSKNHCTMLHSRIKKNKGNLNSTTRAGSYNSRTSGRSSNRSQTRNNRSYSGRSTSTSRGRNSATRHRSQNSGQRHSSRSRSSVRFKLPSRDRSSNYTRSPSSNFRGRQGSKTSNNSRQSYISNSSKSNRSRTPNKRPPDRTKSPAKSAFLASTDKPESPKKGRTGSRTPSAGRQHSKDSRNSRSSKDKKPRAPTPKPKFYSSSPKVSRKTKEEIEKTRPIISPATKTTKENKKTSALCLRSKITNYITPMLKLAEDDQQTYKQGCLASLESSEDTPTFKPMLEVGVKSANNGTTNLLLLLDTGANVSYISDKALTKTKHKISNMVETFTLDTMAGPVKQNVRRATINPINPTTNKPTEIIIRINKNLSIPAGQQPPIPNHIKKRYNVNKGMTEQFDKVDAIIGTDLMHALLSNVEMWTQPGMGPQGHKSVVYHTPWGSAFAGTIPNEEKTFETYIAGKEKDTPKSNKYDRHIIQEDGNLNNICAVLFHQEQYPGDDDKSGLTKDQLEAEEYMEKETIFNTKEKRWEVPILLRKNASLKNGYRTHKTVMKQFHTKSRKSTQTQQVAQDLLDMFKQQGAIEKVNTKTPEKDNAAYVPFTLVHRPESKTTPWRCTANAKFPTPNGNSLNSQLHNVPNDTPPIVILELQNREGPILLSLDISKFFLQINLLESDRDLVRFAWYDLNTEDTQNTEPEIYRFRRLIYGLKTATYICSKVIDKMLDPIRTNPDTTEEDLYFAHRLKKSLYVDDSCTPWQTPEQAIRYFYFVRDLLGEASMKLAKAKSNSTKVLDAIPLNEKSKEIITSTNVRISETDKILGYMIDFEKDEINFSPYKQIREDFKRTKRGLLSTIGKVFDPLGLIGPVNLAAKQVLRWAYMQKDKGWDDLLEFSPEHEKTLDHWFSDIETAASFTIPRNIHYCITTKFHIFADGSGESYGCVAYAVTEMSHGGYKATLAIAKCHVASVTETNSTIPRQELRAASDCVKLAKILEEAFENTNKETFKCYSDSVTVLYWLKGKPEQQTTFVGNRVRVIQEAKMTFGFISTKENPADFASRATRKTALEQSIWREGPNFLKKDPKEHPDSGRWDVSNDADKKSIADGYLKHHQGKIPSKICMAAKRRTGTQTTQYTSILPNTWETKELKKEFNLHDHVHRFGSFSKLVRATARIFQAIHKFKIGAATKITWQIKDKRGDYKTILDDIEITDIPEEHKKQAMIYLFKEDQKLYYTEEYMALIRQKKARQTILQKRREDPRYICENSAHVLTLTRKSPLLGLKPTPDRYDVLRVYGRLIHDRARSYSMRHPVILHQKSRIAFLYAYETHIRNTHPDEKTLAMMFLQDFWVKSPQKLAQTVIKHCYRCQHVLRSTTLQISGPIKTATINATRPFSVISVDYSGSFKLRQIPDQNGHSGTITCYLVVLVCEVTRFLDLKLATDQSASGFIDIMKSHNAIFGAPDVIFSDNAAYFKAVQKIYQQLVKGETTGITKTDITYPDFQKVKNAFPKIKWEFNTARAHWRGPYETFMRLAKVVIRKALTMSKNTDITPALDDQPPTAATVTYNLNLAQMQTVLHCVMGVLNARPLGALSNKPEHLANPLTPSKLALGFTTGIEPTLLHTEEINNRLDHRRVNANAKETFLRQKAIVDSVQDEMARLYLPGKTKMAIWKDELQNIKKSDKVLVNPQWSLQGTGAKQHKWRLATVEQVHPGSDLQVRDITVRIPWRTNKNGSKVYNDIITIPINHSVPIPKTMEDTPESRQHLREIEDDLKLQQIKARGKYLEEIDTKMPRLKYTPNEETNMITDSELGMTDEEILKEYKNLTEEERNPRKHPHARKNDVIHSLDEPTIQHNHKIQKSNHKHTKQKQNQKVERQKTNHKYNLRRRAN